MKHFALLLITTALLPQFSFADLQNCDSRVKREYKRILARGQIELTSFERITNGLAIDQINNSSKPTTSEKKAAITALSSQESIAYLAYSDFMGGTGIEIIITNQRPCKIEAQVMIYAE